ncbi:MAG: ferrochelatase [Chlamydiota bacterium]
MNTKSSAYILACFGDPRSQGDVLPFLQAALTDRFLTLSRLPSWLNSLVFRYKARYESTRWKDAYQKRVEKVSFVPKIEDLATELENLLAQPVIPFYHYLEDTHQDFKHRLDVLECDEITVLPLFPQFSSTMSGAIAHWFDSNLSRTVVNKLRWISSFPEEAPYIEACKKNIRMTLFEHALDAREVFMIFTAKGVPAGSFEDYEDECYRSYQKILYAFPDAEACLAFETPWGECQGLKPYVQDIVTNIRRWSKKRRSIMVVPFTQLTSDLHSQVESSPQMIATLNQQGYNIYRAGPLDSDPVWCKSLAEVAANTPSPFSNDRIITY